MLPVFFVAAGLLTLLTKKTEDKIRMFAFFSFMILFLKSIIDV